MQDRRWLTGYFCADGHIGVSHWSKGVSSIRLMVYSLALDPVKDFQEFFGGTLSPVPARGNHRAGWRWESTGTKAQQILRLMFKGLSERYRWRAALALRFPHHPRGMKGVRGYTEQEKGHREEVRAWLRQLL